MNLNQQLAEFIATKGFISSEVLTKKLKEASAKSLSLYKYLLDTREVDEDLLCRAVAEFFDLKFYSASISTIDEKLITNIPIAFLKENRLVPLLKENDKVIVLIDEPFRVVDADSINYYFDDEIDVRLVTPTLMNSLLNYIDNKIRRADAMNAINSEYQNDKEGEFDSAKLVDAPTVKLTDSILREATAMGASDIHIEPFANYIRVRFRLDGALYTNAELSIASFPAILARIKIMAGMDISERRIPQDGKITMEIDGRKYDYRVSTIPMIFGEKIVIRIFDTMNELTTISQLGFDKEQEEKVRKMISYPHGILLLTGPTGAGKTTTLYSFLKSLNKNEINIVTIEDPVENNIPGINQIQVNTKVNLNFATALRSLLRQDPNIIMVGEIRDEETAQIAVKAAITGHLVLSTLHTNNAHGTISRLIDMGIPKYLVADALIGAISQRLVRRLCPHCKKVHLTDTKEMKDLGLDKPVNIYEPVGCPACKQTGYHGRKGVFEILNMNTNIKNAIEDKDFTVEKIYQTCLNNGLIPLKQACKKLVLDGETSYAEYISLLDNATEEE